MKITIIDDEPDARALLRGLLETYCPDVEITGEAGGVQSGVQQLRHTAPDVVLLDIALPDGTGFDLLDFFPQPAFQVVFTTAHDAFALRAFRYHAADYLLKPISPVELVQVLDRLKNQPAQQSRLLLSPLRDSFQQKKIEKIAISTAEGLSFLPLEEIMRMESDGNYTTFVLLGGEKILASRGLKELEELLPPAEFCRVHQSHVVQLRHVRKFLKEDGGYALMRNGDKIPVSRRKKEEFLALLLA